MSECKSGQGRDFDLLSTPLEGTTLIEASAGTGKTYTLTAVLLRLVAEHGLPIERILVVTFTEAATAELKEKIRTVLWRACREIEGIRSGDRFFAEFAAGIQEPEIAVARLREAIASFDLAVICTIHGFCRRLLHDNAFESGSLFEIELEGDQKEVLLGVVEDFWRERIYRESSLFISYLMDHSVSPESLAVMLGNIPRGPFTRLIPSLKNLDTDAAEARFISSFRKLKQAWMDSGREAAISLEGSGVLKRNIYRPGSIPELVRAMDAYFEQKELTMSLFKGFEKLTASKIAESCKKGSSCPVHQFFDACGMHLEEHRRLDEFYADKLVVFKSQAFEFVQDSLGRRRRETGKMSFDDLLLDVHDALAGPAGARFAEAVRDSFEAVLIDEFQDTDAVQWSIFKRVFHGGGSKVFMIGDPKQAIYAFRGADIFAYMRAAGESEARYTLRTNWRSEAGLLSAVNTLFSRGSQPFVFRDIPYVPSDPASVTSDRRSGTGLHPFNIWFLRPKSEKSVEGRKEARRRIADAVAGEITRLIESGRDGLARIGDEPLSERHIAVLVRTNNEAALMQETLRSLGIASVRHQTGNVFETREAKEIQRLLTAVAEPRDSGLLRAALSTDLMGMRGEDFIRFEGDPDDWERLIDLFHGYNRLWHEQGFIRMMRRLLSERRVVSRAVSMPGGERSATNLLHLSELLQQASAGRRTPEALLKWLFEHIEGGAGEKDEHLIRLESDKEAVTLVTIHKSKGLEYPVVFCPFCWGESTVKKGRPLTFHDPAADFQLVVDIGEKWDPLHVSLAEQELLAENLRLLYVALTRARVACYLVWGSIYNTGTSAPAWIFHRPDPPLQTGVVEALEERCGELSPGRMEEEVKQAAAGAAENIEVLPLPDDRSALPMSGEKTAEELSFRNFKGRIDSEWRLASFSSLVLGAHFTPEMPDHDEAGPGAAVVEEPEPGPAPFEDIFSFPRGARAGSFLHEVLEHADFKNTGKPETADLVRGKCEIHGFNPKWTDAVTGMLQNLVSTLLSPDLPGFTLSELGPEDRLNELEFLFPMARMTPDILAGAFRLHQSGIPGWVPETIGRLQFPPAKGFMKGFIDMVFQRGNRFYLVDWKSNFLGDKIEDYRRERLDRAMETGYYMLQYHIYALALDRYLALRIPNYSYRDHFGGVFYVFLRGVRREAGPDYGIFRDKPSEETIDALRECMLDRNPGQRLN
jgi:exodeoxyribonuclease V beta subunit